MSYAKLFICLNAHKHVKYRESTHCVVMYDNDDDITINNDLVLR